MDTKRPLGSEQNPLRVAVIGSGPSGFYATEALFKSDHRVHVAMFERLPAPFGLVRSGVAPDHPKLKQPILVYDKIARHPEFTFLGNVAVGRDVEVEDMLGAFHAVVFASGAQTDRKLGIQGEDLVGSHTATEFVGWYNGHPDFRDRVFDLSHEVAVIIGQGNVAADVCRMLAKAVDELRHTDIAAHALDVLAESQVREIHIVGRRGPAQAKFTGKELKELGNLPACDAIVNPADLELNPASEAELAEKGSSVGRKNMDIFRTYATDPDPSKPRHCRFHFLRSPVALAGAERLQRIVLEKNCLQGEPFGQIARGSGEYLTLDCGVLFRSIGYRGVPIPGVPYDEARGVFPNEEGRIVDGRERIIPGLYVAGWIKRGPTGIIGTNRADAVATIKALLGDLPRLDTGTKTEPRTLFERLKQKGARIVGYQDWLKLDAIEVQRGQSKGKPREKYTDVEQMLNVLDE